MRTSMAFQAPSLALLATEPLRAILESAFNFAQPELVRGDGHPVVIYPGLGASPMSTSALRTHLNDCGFDVHDWELGVNSGPDGEFDEFLERLVLRVRHIHAEAGRKASLVGWSLGGLYAREIAKRCPDCVRQVVTLATPHNAVGDANHAGTIYRMLGGNTSHLTPALLARLSQRPPVPVTSVYSRSDGVVSWEGCLEQAGRHAENVEVQASHLGMPSHREVMAVVADRLAQPEGRWRPYRGRRALRSRPSAPSRSTM
jgi:pimeloyl-ACP methyl ester carboxylesterase